MSTPAPTPTAAAANAATAPAATAPVASGARTARPLTSFNFRRHSTTPIAVSTDHAERGLRAFNETQSEGSPSTAGHDLRTEGGIPSSAAFTAERA